MSINLTSSATNTTATSESQNTEALTNEKDLECSFATVATKMWESYRVKQSFGAGEFGALDTLADGGKPDWFYGLEDVQVAIDRELLSGESLESAKKFIDAKAKLADNDTANDAKAEKILTGAGFEKSPDGQWLHFIFDKQNGESPPSDLEFHAINYTWNLANNVEMADQCVPPDFYDNLDKVDDKLILKTSFGRGDFVALDSLAYEGTNDWFYGLEDVQVAIDRGLLSGESLESANKFIDAKAKLADNDTANDAEAEKILTDVGFVKSPDGQWLHFIFGERSGVVPPNDFAWDNWNPIRDQALAELADENDNFAAS